MVPSVHRDGVTFGPQGVANRGSPRLGPGGANSIDAAGVKGTRLPVAPLHQLATGCHQPRECRCLGALLKAGA
eukprot:6215726-Alexandrium_andersonii.AAC.1